MRSKKEVLSRVADYLVGKNVSIRDASGWLQARNERVNMAEVTDDNEIIFYFRDDRDWVRYRIGEGQHISLGERKSGC
jgi:hypothetical protein